MRASPGSSFAASMAAALIAASAAHAELGWRWEHPQPTSDHLWPVWGTGPDNVYAGGSDGTLIHYDGTSWRVVLESWSSFLAIGGSGPDDVWAVGGGHVQHFDGTRWAIDFSMSPDYSWHGVWAGAPNDVHLVGTGSGLTAEFAHYDGSGWTISPSPIFSPLEGIWGRASDDVWAVARAALLHFDGDGWEVVENAPGANLMRIWGVDSDRIFVGTSGGDVLLWDGEDLIPIGSGLDYVTGISGSGANDVEIVTYGGKVHRWNGSGWTHTATSPGTRLMGLWTADASEAFAVGDSGTILHRQGASWSRESSAVHSLLMDVWVHSSGDGYAVGEYGTILRFDGERWEKDARFDGREFLWAVWGANPGEVFAAGWKVLHHLEDGVWTADRSIDVTFTDLWGSGADDVYAVGYWGSYHFDGDSWSEISMAGSGEAIRAVWGTGPNDVFAVGDGGTIVHFDGVTWEPMASGTTLELRSVWGSGPDDVWAVGGDSGTWEGVLLHYDGEEWSEIEPQLIDHLLLRVEGRGPSDVFVIGIFDVMHFDGDRWRPVEVPRGFSPQAMAVDGAGELVFVGWGGGVARLRAQFASDFERQNLCTWTLAVPAPDCWPYLP